jgi:hypothetical protein
MDVGKMVVGEMGVGKTGVGEMEGHPITCGEPMQSRGVRRRPLAGTFHNHWGCYGACQETSRQRL